MSFSTHKTVQNIICIDYLNVDEVEMNTKKGRRFLYILFTHQLQQRRKDEDAAARVLFFKEKSSSLVSHQCVFHYI